MAAVASFDVQGAEANVGFRVRESVQRVPRRSPAEWAFETLQHIPDNVFAQDLDGRILMANRALASTYGHASAQDLLGKTHFDVFPAQTAAALRAMDARVLDTGKPVLDQEQDIVYADGRLRWIKASRMPLYDDSQNLIGLVCTFRDITEWKESERLLLAQANLLDMVAQSAPLAEICGKIVSVIEDHLPEVTGAIQFLSPDRTKLLEPVAPTLAGILCRRLNDMTGSLAEAALSAIRTGDPVIVGDVRQDPAFAQDLATLTTAGIGALWAIPIFSLEGKALGALSLLSRSASTPTTMQTDLIAMASHMISNAVERQENEERNKFLASHDPLTRLPNRMMFEECLSAALDAAKEDGTHIGLAFFDMDSFKTINDSMGHAAGDTLLKTVAERAQLKLRPGDVLARLGGDEFVLFLDKLPAQSRLIERRFQTIRDAISAPTDVAGRIVQVTCSMGITYYPDHADTAADLIANADAAMYRAKQLGRDTIQTFTPDMQDAPDERLLRLSSLRDGLTREEFILHYQPQVDLETRQVFAAESLIRWNHPDLGLLYPGDFIPMAEDSGLIVALGEWVLNVACRQNKEWQDEGLPPIVVSVNVSARQFRGPDLVAQVAGALQASGLEPKYLELELTESLIMQEGAAQKMRELQCLGVRLAIDDFGTGYSSLGALKRFPVNRLKIDRTFIRDISNDENDQAITRAIIVMAKTLRMAVIAEGVETADQMMLVDKLGCKEIQGFYFSKPLDSDRFRTLLSDVGGPFRHLFARPAIEPILLDRAAY